MTNFSFRIYKDSTHYITFDSSTNATRVEARVFEWQENHPRKIRITLWNQTDTSSENMLLTSFDGWTPSTTGAVKLGMECYYILWQNRFSDGEEEYPDQYTFYGIITGIGRANNGRVVIEAHDYLYKYENIKFYQTWYANYRDRVHYNTGWYGALMNIDSIDANAYFPGVHVQFAVNDTIFKFGCDADPDGNGGTYTMDTAGDKIAAPFIADHDGTYGFAYHIAYDSGVTGGGLAVKASVQEDVSGYPSGTDLFYEILYHTDDPSGSEIKYGYWYHGGAAGSTPVQELMKGRKYWFVLTLNSVGDASYSMNPQRLSTGTYLDWGTNARYMKNDGGAGWVEDTTLGNLCFQLVYTDYETIDPKDYEYYEYATGGYWKLKLFAVPGQMHAEDAYKTYFGEHAARGRCSYYYNTFNIFNAINDMVGLESGIVSTVSGSMSYNVPLYRSRGKSAAECMREIADLPSIDISGNKFQCSLAHLAESGSHYVGTRRREKVGYDTACTTFAWVKDGGLANYHRIISANLQKTSKARPTKIMVVGRSFGGTPIIATLHDRAVSGSFYDQSKIHFTESIYDESLNTPQQVRDKAKAWWDYFKKDTWEGQLTVSGVYPQVMNLTRYSATEWSGRVIHLHYSPLGIDADFKVTGVVVSENTTEISISNRDTLYENYLLQSASTANKSESFLSPDDPQDFFYFVGYKASTITNTTYYMELQDSGGTALTKQMRSRCTLVDTDNNIRSVQAYFAEWNAVGLVSKVALFTTETGGSASYTFDIPTEMGNVYRPQKWSTTAMLVELQYKTA